MRLNMFYTGPVTRKVTGIEAFLAFLCPSHLSTISEAATLLWRKQLINGSAPYFFFFFICIPNEVWCEARWPDSDSFGYRWLSGQPSHARQDVRTFIRGTEPATSTHRPRGVTTREEGGLCDFMSSPDNAALCVWQDDVSSFSPVILTNSSLWLCEMLQKDTQHKNISDAVLIHFSLRFMDPDWPAALISSKCFLLYYKAQKWFIIML